MSPTAPSSKPKHPSDLGYVMPAEWSRHRATWLTWPKNLETWPNRIEEVQATYIEMISLLSRHELVKILVDDLETEERIRSFLRKKEISEAPILFYHFQTVDSWIRDYGPNYLISEVNNTRRIAMNDWEFNAWGNKYEDLIADTSIPEKISNSDSIPRFTPGMVLEGGSIDVNGKGLCLTTEQCLLNQNRNPRLSRTQIESHLQNYLGITEVIWLGEGVSGDDTDGHIDDIARFVDPETIVCAVEDDNSDENYAPLRENFEKLFAIGEKTGQFRVIPLPMPEPVFADWGRLPASYANFYIANDVVLVPIFGSGRDQKTIEILTGLFPQRKVIGIQSEALVFGMGAIHCLTQQEPKV